jgi:hypothetical protein
MRTTEEIAQIVNLQTRAAKMQAAAWSMPPENFFPNMLGFMAQLDFALAAEVMTAFEITCQRHAEMMDDMIEHPRILTKAIKQAVTQRAQRKARSR